MEWLHASTRGTNASTMTRPFSIGMVSARVQNKAFAHKNSSKESGEVSLAFPPNKLTKTLEDEDGMISFSFGNTFASNASFTTVSYSSFNLAFCVFTISYNTVPFNPLSISRSVQNIGTKSILLGKNPRTLSTRSRFSIFSALKQTSASLVECRFCSRPTSS